MTNIKRYAMVATFTPAYGHELEIILTRVGDWCKYADVKAENERLRDSIDASKEDFEANAGTIYSQKAEIERLRGYLEYLRIHVDSGYTYENIEAGMKSLDDELKEIVDFSEGGNK